MNQDLKNGYYWCKYPGSLEIVLIQTKPWWDDGPFVVHRFGVTPLSAWNLLHPDAKWEGPLVCSL